jgi:hypothetical protein
MTHTAASTETLYIGTREEADVEHPRTNEELVAALRARTRELREGERVEADITPPDDPFGV